MGVTDTFLGRLLGNADKYSNEQVSQTVTLLIEHGVKHGATDIHLEPHDRFGIVRYRIDGTLRSTHKLPVSALPAVITEIKTLAGLRTATTNLPQEGQYKVLVGEDEFEIQVHTLPVIGGEKVVLHILRRLNTPLTLQALGFWGHNLQLLQTALSRTHGLVLTGMPRRQGMTSTLHSMLKLITVPTLSIATVENAIEYRVAGASQTVVRPHHGITFHQALQATLNQDPNVVMITSLPNRPTTDLAIQASVGGHMVIAGLHANNAAATLAHVRSMTDEPFLLATALRAVVSQRLVRALCVHCRERFIPSPDQITQIEKAFGVVSPAARRKVNELEQAAMQAGIDHNKQVNTTPTHLTALWRAHDDGCEHCGHTGYVGMIAITEVLIPSEHTQKGILSQDPASKLHTAALQDGFIPMELDGLVKALRGQTTIAEVMRTLNTQS
jgi:type II secretory ATPase GspE/PulE/Tfp pilus assembly ATPase PilB-like protein